MADKISDNVGKKIVEALKMQKEGANYVPPQEEETSQDFQQPEENETLETNEEMSFSEPETEAPILEQTNKEYNSTPAPFKPTPLPDIETAFQDSLNNNLGVQNFTAPQTDVEYPNNVAILNHLITKLPAGVTKQTGAIIIRQTMEALGIPMKSVIQEARQVQETLSNKAKECQRNILDYKKQISTLEIKSQQYQRQAVVMNDTINLFLNTGV